MALLILTYWCILDAIVQNRCAFYQSNKLECHCCFVLVKKQILFVFKLVQKKPTSAVGIIFKEQCL